MAATVYIARDREGDVLYVGCTENFHKRMLDHGRQSLGKRWVPLVDYVERREFATLGRARRVETKLIKELQPRFNIIGVPGAMRKRGGPVSARKDFGVILKQRRVDLGLPQAELAKRLGVSSQTIGNWEHGRTVPASGRRDELAALLEMEAVELFGDDVRQTGSVPTSPHGTLAAVRRHSRYGEKPCDACKAAIRVASRRSYQLRKERLAAAVD